LDLNLRKKLLKCYIWSTAFVVWCWNLGHFENRSEIRINKTVSRYKYIITGFGVYDDHHLILFVNIK
jgi:hypothetical protein